MFDNCNGVVNPDFSSLIARINSYIVVKAKDATHTRPQTFLPAQIVSRDHDTVTLAWHPHLEDPADMPTPDAHFTRTVQDCYDSRDISIWDEETEARIFYFDIYLAF